MARASRFLVRFLAVVALLQRESAYFHVLSRTGTQDNNFLFLFLNFDRVWKGIFGIPDLTKLRCGNRENDKYIDGIRDLTVPREAGLAKNWARDAGFMFACLSGMPETFKNTRKFKISIERINLHLTFISFCRN